MMRRKSERNKGKSPEKVEKTKRSRPSRKRKKSSSSSPERDSGSEDNVQEVQEGVVVPELPPKTSEVSKSDAVHSDDGSEPIWHVKTSESSGETGEIQKLKICLSRPSSTPERPDRSPRGRKKLNRSSQLDFSSEPIEEKRRTRHKSRRNSTKDISLEECTKSVDTKVTEQSIIDVIPENLEPPDEAPFAESTVTVIEESVPAKHNLEEQMECKNVEDKNELNENICIQDPNITATGINEQASPRDDEKSINDDVKKSLNQSDKVEKVVEEMDQEFIEKEENKIEALEEKQTVEVKDNELPRDEESKEKEIIQHEETKCSEINDNTKDESNLINDKVEIEKGDISQDNSSCLINETNITTISTSVITEPNISTCEITEPDISTCKITEPTISTCIPSEQTNNTEITEPINNTSIIIESIANNCVTVEPIDTASVIIESMPNLDEKECRNETFSEEISKNSIDTSKIDVKAVEDKGGLAIEPVSIRKRRWGSRSSKVNKVSTVCISTDSLKDLIPNIEPVSVEEVLLDDKNKEPEVKPKRSSIDEKKPNGKYGALEKVKEKDILGNLSHRKISIVNQESPKEQRPPSPPKYKTSCILYITNLVRPFTLAQLKNLLQRTGRLTENGFWIDKIKSRCYVQYQTEDEAVETRHALHGVTWPVSNPKTLNVDFGSPSAMREALASGEDERVIGHVDDVWHKDSNMPNNLIGKEKDSNYEKRTVIREWDVGKGDSEMREERMERLEQGSGYSRGQGDVAEQRGDRERERRKRRTKSPSPARKFKKKEEEAPSKLLDDLFKKTKTTPCIYWLPLNPEVILIKEEQRRKHMAEHERRMEELRRAAEEQTRGLSRHTSHHAPNHRHR